MNAAVRRVLRGLLLAIVLVVAAMLSGLVPISLSVLRAPIERAVHDASGLVIHLNGPLRLKLGPLPALNASDIEIAHAGDDSQPFVAIDRLTVGPRIIALLLGDLHLRTVSIGQGLFDYCIFENGIAAVSESPAATPSESPSDTPAALPSIAIERIEAQQLLVACGADATEPAVTLNDLKAAAAESGPMAIQAILTVSDGLQVEFDISSGNLNDLLNRAPEIPLNLRVVAADAKLRADGRVLTPLEEPRADLRFELSADSLSLLETFAGLDLDYFGSFDGDGRILASVEEIQVTDLDLRLGQTRLRGMLSVDLLPATPYVDANLSMGALDAAPIETLIETMKGLDAQPEPDSTGDWTQYLAVVDGRLSVTVESLLNAPVDIDSALALASVKDGVVEISELTVRSTIGNIDAAARFDGTRECPAYSVSGQGRDLVLDRFVASGNPEQDPEVQISSIDFDAAACGLETETFLTALAGRLEVAGAMIRYGEADVPLSLTAATISTAAHTGTAIDATGALLGEPFTAALELGTLEQLRAATPSPLLLRISAPNAELSVNGEIRIDPAQAFLDAMVSARSSGRGALSTWLGIESGSELPISLDARASIDGDQWMLDGLALSVGQSDVSGRLAWRGQRENRFIDVDLASQNLWLEELAQLFPPDDAETPTETQTADALLLALDVPILPREFEIPEGDLNVFVGNIVGIDPQLSEIQLDGTYRDGELRRALLQMTVDDVPLTGELNLDLRAYLARLDLKLTATDIDFGRYLNELELIDGVTSNTKTIAIELSATGNTVRRLTEQALLTVTVEDLELQIPAPEEKPPFVLALDRTEILLRPDLPTVVRSSGEIEGERLRLLIETATVADIFTPDKSLPVSVELESTDDRLVLETILPRPLGNRIHGTIRVSGDHLNLLEPDPSTPRWALSDYEISGTFDINPSGYFFNDIAARIGTSHLNGNAEIHTTGERSAIEVTLVASLLQLGEFIEPPQEQTGEIAEEEPEEEVPEPVKGIDAVVREWLRAMGNAYDTRISVTAQEVLLNQGHLGSLRLGVVLNDREIRIAPLQLDLPGGRIDITYDALETEGGIRAQLKALVDGFEYGLIARQLDPDSTASGWVYLDTELTAEASNAAGLLGTANGYLDFAAIPDGVFAGFLDIWTANLVLAILPVVGDGDDSQLNCVVARFDVDDGIMEHKTILMDTTKTLVRGRGTIDLGQQELDITIWPQAKREKFFSMSTPVLVSGPWQDFNIGVAPGGVITTMLRFWYNLIYVPVQWLVGERFPADGIATCANAFDLDLQTADQVRDTQPAAAETGAAP